MTAAALADVLVDLGVERVSLAAVPGSPGRLRHRPATMPAHLREGLLLHKDAVLALLQAGRPGADDGGVYLERMGMADELGMATHTGSPAWLIAVGESLRVCRGQGAAVG